MSGTLNCSIHLLDVHDMWGTMGSVFIAAMIIGALLDESWRKMLNWVMAAVVFAVIEQYIRYTFRVKLGFDPSFLCESNGVSILVAAFYATGLSLGWSIVYFGKRRVRLSYRRETEEKEKENAK